MKHLQEQPVPPSSVNPNVPGDWDNLILKALQKEPVKRYRSATLMGQAISELGDNLPSRPDRKAWAARVFLASSLTAAALVAGLVMWRLPAHANTSTSAKIQADLSRLAAHGQLSGTVLVAQRGRILVDQGYSLADRRLRRPNRPNTRYPVAGLSPILSLTADLQFAEAGLPRWHDSICRYLPRCTQRWAAVTVGMLLDGTSHLPWYDGFGNAGTSVAQSLAGCQSLPLDGKPGSGIDYQNCDYLVLAMIAQTAGGPWAHTGIFGYPGVRNSGQMLDTTRSPDLASDYDGALTDPSTAYNASFTAYSTASDILAFDNDLFNGSLLTRVDLQRVLTPRAPLITPDPGVTHARWGFYWKTGTLLGHRVAYSIDTADYFQDVNIRFLDPKVTVVVLSNNALNNVWDIAVRVSALVFDKPTLRSPRLTAPPIALLGTYQRVFHNEDRLAARDRGLENWVGVRQTVAFRGHVLDYNRGSVDEFYNARTDGSLSLVGFTATNQSSFCSYNQTETPPTGHYHWSRSGNKLIIKKVSDSLCPDRASLMPGIWTKIS